MKESLTHKTGLRIGVTGGIGSGKSTVCRVFEQLGIPVYDADYWAKWLLNNDPDLIEGVKKIFGPEAYTPEGQYNKTYIAKEAFGDPAKLAALNAIAHPAVERHGKAWHEDEIAKGALYTVKEAALMIESGNHKHLDFLIVVTAPEETRIKRVMQRDQTTEEQVRARMKHQMAEEERVKYADAVIRNDGIHPLVPQVWALHQQFLKQIQ